MMRALFDMVLSVVVGIVVIVAGIGVILSVFFLVALVHNVSPYAWPTIILLIIAGWFGEQIRECFR